MKKTRKTLILAVFALIGAFAIALGGLNIGAKEVSAQTYYPYNYSTQYGYQTPDSSCYNFNTDLQIGSTGPAVEALHNALAREGFYRTNSSYSNQNYTEETASLVSGFQEKYRSEILTPLGYRFGTGYVGSYTRTKLNSLYGTSYNNNCSGNNDNSNITITVSPLKTNYNLYEDITFSILARNNSSYERTLDFNSGCQTSYRIGTYDSASNQACTLAFTNVRIPAYGTYTWTVVHRMNTYNLSSGSYTLIGRVIGYGESSATIYINNSGGGSGSGTNYPRVTRPNSGEWLRRATYETISWELPTGNYYFQAQAVDVSVIPQYSYGGSYYQDSYYGYSNSTCPVGQTCAYTGGSYSGYNQPQPTYQTSSYSILRNTLLTSYNWYVGSTPNGWSTIPAGSYKLQVCLTGTTLCDLSDSFFNIYN